MKLPRVYAFPDVPQLTVNLPNAFQYEVISIAVLMITLVATKAESHNMGALDGTYTGMTFSWALNAERWATCGFVCPRIGHWYGMIAGPIPLGPA